MTKGCVIHMKTNRSVRMIILIFLLSALLAAALGCQDLPREKLPSESETGESDPTQSDQITSSVDEQEILKKWEGILADADAAVKSADVQKYTMQPAYSSVTTVAETFTLEGELVIEELLGIIRELDVSFADYEFDENEIDEFYTSHIGQETIEMMLKDSEGTDIFGLRLYENGDIDILEAREITETKKTYEYICRVSFEESNREVYEDLASFLENNLTE